MGGAQPPARAAPSPAALVAPATPAAPVHHPLSGPAMSSQISMNTTWTDFVQMRIKNSQDAGYPNQFVCVFMAKRRQDLEFGLWQHVAAAECVPSAIQAQWQLEWPQATKANKKQSQGCSDSLLRASSAVLQLSYLWVRTALL